MQAQEDYFEASDGAKIFVRTFTPAAEKPTAVLHVHHGLGEHSGRYRELAEALVAEGLVVVAHDARGHGKTSEAAELGLGCIPAGPEGAVPRMAADLGELIAASHASRPSTPVLLFGHSFGTVISQLCVGGGGAKVDGLLLSAPPARFPAIMKPVLSTLCALLNKVYGAHGVSKIPNKLSFDKFQKLTIAAVGGVEKPTGWEWLNRDPECVAKYISDPFCGHDLSVGFWVSAVQAFYRLQDPASHAALPPSLPLCIFAGEQDYVTIDDFGTASYHHIQKELLKSGKGGPKIIVYPRARHEILHETNREEVIDDILAFVRRCLAGGAPRSRL